MPRPAAPSIPTTRVCSICGHQLLRALLDTGDLLELDTQALTYVGTGREQDGLEQVIERGYILRGDGRPITLPVPRGVAL